jgi:hypothetical protein
MYMFFTFHACIHIYKSRQFYEFTPDFKGMCLQAYRRSDQGAFAKKDRCRQPLFLGDVFEAPVDIDTHDFACQRVYVFLSVTEEQHAYKQKHARQRDKVFVTTFVLFA